MELKCMSHEELEKEVEYYKRVAKYWETKFKAKEAEADLLSGGMLDAVLCHLQSGGKLHFSEVKDGNHGD